MWLDMYMRKQYEVINYEWQEGPKYEVTVTQGWEPVPWLEDFEVYLIVTEAMYWRKANAIHNWFVENVQGWEDNCQEYDVDHSDLIELMKLCKQVLDTAVIVKWEINNWYSTSPNWEKVYNKEQGEYIQNAEAISELLPTWGWCFFGSTDYDQWYLNDIKDTYDWLVRETESPLFKKCDYMYQSSW